MQAIDLATIKAAKATDRRTLAILAYDNATANPDGANWRAVADILRLVLPAAKAPKIPEAETDPRFAPWSEHEIPVFGHAKKFGKSPILVVTFADGEKVRAPAVSLPGKPVNVGRALRVAFAYYRGRIAHRCGAFSETAGCVMVPDIVSVTCETTATEYDPADCSARTAELRAGAFDYFAALAAAWEGDACEDIADHTRTEYLKAARAARRSTDATEYTDDDRRDICDWTKSRPAVSAAMLATTGDLWGTEERAARLAWAIMAFWPDLADSELSAVPDAPTEIAAPVVPVAPSFKVASRFLASSRLVAVAPSLPVAPSCILRAG